MVTMDAYHLLQLLQGALFEAFVVFFTSGIGAGVPIPVRLKSADTPERRFRPEEHAFFIAGF